MKHVELVWLGDNFTEIHSDGYTFPYGKPVKVNEPDVEGFLTNPSFKKYRTGMEIPKQGNSSTVPAPLEITSHAPSAVSTLEEEKLLKEPLENKLDKNPGGENK